MTNLCGSVDYISTLRYMRFVEPNDIRAVVASSSISQSTDVTSTDPVSAKGKTKEVYCYDIVVLIVLF